MQQLSVCFIQRCFHESLEQVFKWKMCFLLLSPTVQDYMQTFGALTQPAGPTEDAISRHSINFYESLWQQHQRELFYPRSNTISVFSSISNDSASSSSTGGGGMLAMLGVGPGGVGGSLEGLSALAVLPVKVKRVGYEWPLPLSISILQFIFILLSYV